MALDVEKIVGTPAKAAARLCNFKTGQSFLLLAHQDYLDNDVRTAIQKTPKPWVELFGYASRVGDSAFNVALSEQRVSAVRARIGQYSNRVEFRTEVAYGELKSGPDETNNDGKYRAVEVFVYADKPPTPRPSKVRRIVFRTFFKSKVTRESNPSTAPDIKKDAINDLLKLGVSLIKGQLEGPFGPEISHQVQEVGRDHKVNKVTVDRRRTLDQFMGGDQVTETTTVSYEWGPPDPSPFVLVVHHFVFVWNGKVDNEVNSTELILRKEADANGLIVPPDP